MQKYIALQSVKVDQDCYPLEGQTFEAEPSAHLALLEEKGLISKVIVDAAPAKEVAVEIAEEAAPKKGK